jgi:dipeptidyl-peptidase 4
MQQLQSRGKQFELMTYPGGKHGLVRLPEMGKHFYAMVIEYFERELKAGE